MSKSIALLFKNSISFSYFLLFFHIFSRTIYYTLSSSFVVAHAPDQAHRHAALIPVLTGLFVVALISISLVKYLGDRNVTKAVEDRG